MEPPALVSKSRFDSNFSKEQVVDCDGSEYDGSAGHGSLPPRASPLPKPEPKHNFPDRPGLAPSVDPGIPDLVQVSDSDDDPYNPDVCLLASLLPTHGPIVPSGPPSSVGPPPSHVHGTHPSPDTDPDMPELQSCSGESSSNDSVSDFWESSDSDDDDFRAPSLGPIATSGPPSPVRPPPSHVHDTHPPSDTDPDMPGLQSCSGGSSSDDSVSDFWASSGSDDDEFRAPSLGPLHWPPADLSSGSKPSPPAPRTLAHLGNPDPESDDELPDLTSGDDTDTSGDSDSESSDAPDDDYAQSYRHGSAGPDDPPSLDAQALESLARTSTSTSATDCPLDYDVLAGAVGPTWLARPLGHDEIAPDQA